MSYGTYNHKGSLITRWVLRVCGLTAIQNHSYINLDGEKPQDFVDGLFEKDSPGCDSYSKSGNLLFGFSSSQYIQRSSLPVLRYLLEHPNTKIIHFYQNNAHGPSVVFIAIYHAYPDQVERKIINNVKKVLSYLDTNSDSYQDIMKPGAENAL